MEAVWKPSRSPVEAPLNASWGSSWKPHCKLASETGVTCPGLSSPGWHWEIFAMPPEGVWEALGRATARHAR
eukprot:1613780-Alexandrium_andersonii.AAC.1